MKKYLAKFTPAGRLEYAGMCLMLTALVAMSAVNAFALPSGDVLFGSAFWLAEVGVMLVLAACALVLHSWRRLLDLNEPPRRAWLALIPGYNLYFMGRLMARPGATPPPSHGGKTAGRSSGARVGDSVILGLGAVIWIMTLLRFV